MRQLGVLNLRGGYLGRHLVIEACFEWLATATELRYRSLGHLGHGTASNICIYLWAADPVQPTHARGEIPPDPTHVRMAGQLVNGSSALCLDRSSHTGPLSPSPWPLFRCNLP